MHVTGGSVTWQDPVEVPILYLLIVLIFLQTEYGVGQMPINEACLFGFCQTLQHKVSLNPVTL